MSKKYKGKICVYCVEALATGRDHVIAREFFAERRRANLPQVPACDACNSRKGRLETVFTALLPLASDHPVAVEISSRALTNRLAKNAALRRSVFDSMRPIWREMPSGLLLPSGMFPGHGEEFEELFDLIVRGLSWHEWRAFIPKDYDVRVGMVPPEGRDGLRPILLSCGLEYTVIRRYADGGFVYTAARNKDSPALSMWELAFYDGPQLAAPRGRKIVPLFVFALVGPRALIEREAHTAT